MQLIYTSKSLALKITLLLFIFIGAIPLLSLTASKVFPLLDWMLVFIICLYRSAIFRMRFLWIVGIIKDLLFGLPLGMTSLLYTILYEATSQFRENHARDNFHSVWYFFIVSSGSLMLLYWLLNSMFFHQLLPVVDVIIQWITTVLVYPIVHEYFSRILQHIPNELSTDAE